MLYVKKTIKSSNKNETIKYKSNQISFESVLDKPNLFFAERNFPKLQDEFGINTYANPKVFTANSDKKFLIEFNAWVPMSGYNPALDISYYISTDSQGKITNLKITYTYSHTDSQFIEITYEKYNKAIKFPKDLNEYEDYNPLIHDFEI